MQFEILVCRLASESRVFSVVTNILYWKEMSNLIAQYFQHSKCSNSKIEDGNRAVRIWKEKSSQLPSAGLGATLYLAVNSATVQYSTHVPWKDI
jgi:hypothetical protein